MEFLPGPRHAPYRWRCYYVALTFTGLRLEELRELRPEDLDHEAQSIRLKSESGSRTIYVAEEFWHWVVASVPLSFTQSFIRDNWNAAVERSGLKNFRLSDLRRLRSNLPRGGERSCWTPTRPRRGKGGSSAAGGGPAGPRPHGGTAAKAPAAGGQVTSRKVDLQEALHASYKPRRDLRIDARASTRGAPVL
jgi:hypothetical protein